MVRIISMSNIVRCTTRCASTNFPCFSISFFHHQSSSWMLTIARSRDRKSTRLNSSHLVISYAVFCLKKKKDLLLHTGRPHAHHRLAAHLRYQLSLDRHPQLVITDDHEHLPVSDTTARLFSTLH